jgi:hypothetical protein
MFAWDVSGRWKRFLPGIRQLTASGRLFLSAAGSGKLIATKPLPGSE